MDAVLNMMNNFFIIIGVKPPDLFIFGKPGKLPFGIPAGIPFQQPYHF
jgi:hypothetical protein